MSGKSRSVKRNVEKSFFLKKLAEHEKKLDVIDKYITNIESILLQNNVVTRDQLDAAVADAMGAEDAVSPVKDQQNSVEPASLQRAEGVEL